MTDSDDKPLVYLDGDRAIYRASGLWSCHNALLLARLGYQGSPPPKKLQVRYDEGHDQEPLILNRLRDQYGFRLHSFQATMEIDCGPNAMVRGHVDALADPTFSVTRAVVEPGGVGVSFDDPFEITADGPVVVDAKALADSTYKSWLKGRWTAFPYYLWQQASYVHAGGWAGIVMACKNKATGDYAVEYFSADSLEVRLHDIIGRVLEIERLAEDPQNLFATECTKMYPCPFWRHHPVTEKAKVTKGSVEGHEAEIAELAKLRWDAQQRENEAKTDKEELDKKILELYDGREATGTGDGWSLTTYRSSYSTTDWAAIAEGVGLPSIDAAKEKFTSSQKSKKLSVRPTPPKELTAADAS